MEYNTTTHKTSNIQHAIYERSKEVVHQHVLSAQMFLYGLHAVELTPVVQLQKNKKLETIILEAGVAMKPPQPLQP